MKSGVVKQKWTPEEEAALRAGVEKYGAGKWRAIQKDADYGACLTSRSNVDLKDKWRNMSVSANGLGSRERAARVLATKMKHIGTPSAQGVSGVTFVDTLSVTNAAKERKHVGARLDNLILEAISNLKDTNGGSKGQIATYLESHYPVPVNFRRLLAAKLKLLTQQGKLTKMRRNYYLARDLASVDELCDHHGFQDSVVRKQAPDYVDFQVNEGIVCKLKSMAADEVVMVAAQAVADAEAAAAAAEEAARIAEIAEAEWEIAEAAAEMAAALATGSAKVSLLSPRQGTLAVSV